MDETVRTLWYEHDPDGGVFTATRKGGYPSVDPILVRYEKPLPHWMGEKAPAVVAEMTLDAIVYDNDNNHAALKRNIKGILRARVDDEYRKAFAQ